jgi:phosphoglycerate-specific signal transduction histidine kinase
MDTASQKELLAKISEFYDICQEAMADIDDNADVTDASENFSFYLPFFNQFHISLENMAQLIHKAKTSDDVTWLKNDLGRELAVIKQQIDEALAEVGDDSAS